MAIVARAAAVNLATTALADLVILAGNPLEEIRNTRKVKTVIKNGAVYDAREVLESVRGQLGPRGPEELALW